LNPAGPEAEPESGPDPRVMLAQSLANIMTEVNSCTTDTIVNAAKRLVDELPVGTPGAVVTAHLTASAQRDDAARGDLAHDPHGDHAKGGHDWHLFPNSVILHGLTYRCAIARGRTAPIPTAASSRPM